MTDVPSRPYGTPAPPGAPTGAMCPPLIRATTWAVDDAESARALGARASHADFYARYGHPNARGFEAALAALERAAGAVSFASGMAAVHAVFGALCSAGDRVLVADRIYGGTDALCRHELPRFGIVVERFDPLDPADLDRALERAGARPPRLCFVESPINPTLRIVDLAAVAARCGARGVTVAADVTFAPPPLQRGLEAGLDLVVHSATKYLGGHSDVLAGVVAGRDHELLTRIEAFRVRTGAILAPDPAWLLQRSLATLELRVLAQSRAAAWLAHQLAADAGPGRPLAAVLHPALADHPDHQLARRALPAGAGGVLAFEVRGGLPAARRLHDALRVAARAPSLGGVETLVSLPCLSSHAHVEPAARARAGVADGLVRVAVGLEPAEQLLDDLRAAIAAAVD
ncbi:MAG: PLP-dependent transferase [Planctomycetes bacterium]|nr:PLP-dependent transferase [Planctomycetota bacterium]